MQPFTLGRQAAIASGPGTAKQVGTLCAELMGGPSHVLLIADPALVALHVLAPVEVSLREAGHTVTIFSGLTSDPKESAVDSAVALARDVKADCVVAAGGGAALDVGKLAAALIDASGACADYRLSARPMPFRKRGLICIPTTAGTGAETTATSIISDPDGVKNWFNGPSLRADIAILDPELTVSLPPFWTFYTGLDALVHAIESRTNRYRFDENDRQAERAIALVAANLERAVADPGDLNARGAMLHGAALAGASISNTGCAIAHNIGHALGSLAAIPHGRAVSVSMVKTLDWSMEVNRDAYASVATLLGVGDENGIAAWCENVAARCGQSLELSAVERAAVSGDALAEAMVEPANIAMLHSTARDASQAEIRELAHAVVG